MTKLLWVALAKHCSLPEPVQPLGFSTPLSSSGAQGCTHWVRRKTRHPRILHRAFQILAAPPAPQLGTRLLDPTTKAVPALLPWGCTDIFWPPSEINALPFSNALPQIIAPLFLHSFLHPMVSLAKVQEQRVVAKGNKHRVEDWGVTQGWDCCTWVWALKVLLIKQWKKILSACPISISMAFHHQLPWWSYGAQLNHYNYFKNNRHVHKGDCIWLSALKFKNSCTDAISGWGWRQPCEWKPKMCNINQP